MANPTSQVSIPLPATRKLSSIYPYLTFAVFLIFVLLSPVNTGAWSYSDVVQSVPNHLKGNYAVTEIAQDIYGFKALIYGLDPYAILNDAVPMLGTEWGDESPTTHPPTAFLFVAPIAFLPLRIAFATWSWLMVAAVIVSLRAYGFSWSASVSLGLLSMLWPPTITSLGNLPCIWMLEVALAYRERNRNPLLAGVWIGVASFTKLLPAILLVPFIIKKKWITVIGFAITWLLALGIISIISPTVIYRYLEVMKEISFTWITWVGNGYPFIFLYRYYGLPGLGCGLFLLLSSILLNWRKWLNQDKDISPDAWHMFSFLSVILLPIAWAYSIAPLYPGLLLLAASANPRRILGILAITGPVIAVVFHLPSVAVILFLAIPYCMSWMLTLDHRLIPSLSKPLYA